MNKQHVQLPHNMTKSGKLVPNDLLVYLTIKRYMNNITKQAFPALRTLSADCGFSVDTIRKSIKKLEKEGWIVVEELGRKNIYNFIPHKGLFEMFSYDFLDNDIPPREKAYLIAAQQFMIKENNLGKTSYSDKELSEKLNLSEHQIQVYDKSLEDEGALVVTKARENFGIGKSIKFFDLEKLGQALLFVNEKVNKIAEKQEKTDKTTLYLMEEVRLLSKQMKQVREVQQQMNPEIIFNDTERIYGNNRTEPGTIL